MSDAIRNLKKRREFVIFERKNSNSRPRNKNKIIQVEQTVKKQQHRIGEKLKAFENNQERRIKKRKSQKEGEKKLDNLAKMTENRLFSMSSVWPFDFFPNKVYIEEKQIIIVLKQFFFINQEYQILIQDILVPVVENGLLFSTLKIQLGPGGFQQDPPPVRYLPKNDAQIAKDIIMGLLVCHKEKINLENLETEELINKLVEIGRYRKD